MNRIDQLLPGQTQPGTPAKPAARPEGAPSFQQLLDQASQATRPDPAQAPAAVAGPQAPAPTSAVAAVAATPELGPTETEGLLRAERTLDLLDAYQNGLADGKKSLKELSGLVKALDEEVGELTKALERLEPESGLHGLMSQVAVAAMVESIKFNRGDYAPAPPETGEEAAEA